jgi:predicted nucleic acid-binding protein
MKIFLDTSSLIKLYHEEVGTDYLDSIFEDFKITNVYLSELAKVEYNSAVMKKVRTKELTEDEAKNLIDSFENDCQKYSFISIDHVLVQHAKELVVKYGSKGLRTLDSLQLASVIEAKTELDFAVTADDLLKSLIQLEGIDTK